MKAVLGIPYWGDNAVRETNFKYVRELMADMFPWEHIYDNYDGSFGEPTRGGVRNYLVDLAIRDSADVVVLCDADSFTEPTALRDAIYGAYTQGGLHFAYDKYRRLSPTGTQHLLNKTQGVDPFSYVHSQGLGSLGGVMAIEPSDWSMAFGSPELTGWGFEDVMFAVQARTLIRENTWHPGFITCLWHETACSVGSYQYNINIGYCKQLEALDGDAAAIRKFIMEHPEIYPL